MKNPFVGGERLGEKRGEGPPCPKPFAEMNAGPIRRPSCALEEKEKPHREVRLFSLFYSKFRIPDRES